MMQGKKGCRVWGVGCVIPELVEGSLVRFPSRKAAKETPSTQRNQYLRATPRLPASPVPGSRPPFSILNATPDKVPGKIIYLLR